jgi:hypothetical protein
LVTHLLRWIQLLHGLLCPQPAASLGKSPTVSQLCHLCQCLRIWDLGWVPGLFQVRGRALHGLRWPQMMFRGTLGVYQGGHWSWWEDHWGPGMWYVFELATSKRLVGFSYSPAETCCIIWNCQSCPCEGRKQLSSTVLSLTDLATPFQCGWCKFLTKK